MHDTRIPQLLLRRDQDFELAHPFTYRWTVGPTLRRIKIPMGFVTDLASTPVPVRWLVPRTDLGLIAPLVYDFIYRNRGPLTRREADRLFCRIMREEGVPKWKRRVAFWSVRLFGWRHW